MWYFRYGETDPSENIEEIKWKIASVECRNCFILSKNNGKSLGKSKCVISARSAIWNPESKSSLCVLRLQKRGGARSRGETGSEMEPDITF